jgi:hypothetical protein
MLARPDIIGHEHLIGLAGIGYFPGFDTSAFRYSSAPRPFSRVQLFRFRIS